MWLTIGLVTALVALLLVLVGFGAWAYRTANRLDRLHVRYDLSWQALDAALARRAVVARTVAANVFGGPSDAAAKQLVTSADAAETAPRQAREGCENKLAAALAMIDPASVPAGVIAEPAVAFPGATVNASLVGVPAPATLKALLTAPARPVAWAETVNPFPARSRTRFEKLAKLSHIWWRMGRLKQKRRS